jgi:hypothetical protein
MSSGLAKNRLLKQSKVKNYILRTDKENDTETNPFSYTEFEIGTLTIVSHLSYYPSFAINLEIKYYGIIFIMF